MPDWFDGDGRRGEEVQCNTHVYAGTDRVIGNNTGSSLPEAVAAPCGREVMRRRQIVARTEPWAGSQVLNSTRMTRLGVHMPKGHAEKFARPCAQCFPSGPD